MRVLIIGAGIAGLTLGIFLRRYGCHPVIVEKRSELADGFVVLLWPPGSRVLRQAGLLDAVRELGEVTEYQKAYDLSGRLISQMCYGDVVDIRELPIGIERRRLADVLLGAVEQDYVRFSTTVQCLSQNGDSVSVQFSDGMHDRFDAVAVCDGLRSNSRRWILGEQPVACSGWRVWAWWLPREWAGNAAIREYWDAGRNLGIYPARHAACCYCATWNLGVAETGNADRLRKAFEGMGGEVPKVLQHLPVGEEPWTDALCDFRAPRWVAGRMALAGDAAVTCLPMPGFGASLAMEAAEVLARCLAGADLESVPRALWAYADHQRRRAERLQKTSRRFAKIGLMRSRLGAAIRNRIVATASIRAGHRLLLHLPW